MELGRVKIRRQSLRLKDYDYSGPGAYFVTICTRDRLPLFGDIVEGRMRLTEYGRIVSQEWETSATIRQELTLDAFVVMPKHVHGVVIIKESNVGATGGSPIRRDHTSAPWDHFSAGSNRPQPNVLMIYNERRDLSGNATIMNT